MIATPRCAGPRWQVVNATGKGAASKMSALRMPRRPRSVVAAATLAGVVVYIGAKNAAHDVVPVAVGDEQMNRRQIAVGGERLAELRTPYRHRSTMQVPSASPTSTHTRLPP